METTEAYCISKSKSHCRNTKDLSIVSCFIVSINRSSSQKDAELIADYAIEYHAKYPDIVVGVELSGNPAVGKFQDFVPALNRARKAGLKVINFVLSDLLITTFLGKLIYYSYKLIKNIKFQVTLHCGEICNPEEVVEMLNFKPERIGHGTCIHPAFGGNNMTWELLCKSQIPVGKPFLFVLFLLKKITWKVARL